jgi:hypothetical protein
MTTAAFNDYALPFEKSLGKAFMNVWDFVEEDNNTNWTKAVKTILDSEVRKIRPNLKVAACSITTADCTEWLYDFVCYENSELGLKDVLLVAESEWRGRFTSDYLQDVQDDFEKLLLARSPYRLMIFEGDDEAEIINTISHLKKIVMQCKLSTMGDRYMFAGWVKSKEFYYDLHIHN